jgi:hypothetical protein
VQNASVLYSFGNFYNEANCDTIPLVVLSLRNYISVYTFVPSVGLDPPLNPIFVNLATDAKASFYVFAPSASAAESESWHGLLHYFQRCTVCAGTIITDFVVYGEEIPPDSISQPAVGASNPPAPVSQRLFLTIATSSGSGTSLVTQIVTIDLAGECLVSQKLCGSCV